MLITTMVVGVFTMVITMITGMMFRLPDRCVEADIDERFGAPRIGVQPIRYILVLRASGQPRQLHNSYCLRDSMQRRCRRQRLLFAGLIGIREDYYVAISEHRNVDIGPLRSTRNRGGTVFQGGDIFGVSLAFAKKDSGVRE